jgi:hypothetical protein
MSLHHIKRCLEAIEDWGVTDPEKTWQIFLKEKNSWTIDEDYYDRHDCASHPVNIAPFVLNYGPNLQHRPAQRPIDGR